MGKEAFVSDKVLAVFEECCKNGEDPHGGMDPRVTESVPNLLYLNGRFVPFVGEEGPKKQAGKRANCGEKPNRPGRLMPLDGRSLGQ